MKYGELDNMGINYLDKKYIQFPQAQNLERTVVQKIKYRWQLFTNVVTILVPFLLKIIVIKPKIHTLKMLYLKNLYIRIFKQFIATSNLFNFL